MDNSTPDLVSGTQTAAAVATALGLMTGLVEELVRAGSLDAARLEVRFDEFAQSASVAAGAAPGEALYVERLVKLIKKGLYPAPQGHGDE